MDCGKSTLALQMHHTHRSAGRQGLLLTRHDRAGAAVVSSRLGLQAPAVEVSEHLDLWGLVVDRHVAGEQVDYLVCDEAQFLTVTQVDELAQLVDDLAVDVLALGITTDFRTHLFPGSARLVELADRVQTLPVHAWCWCGARATHNARTLDGVMVVAGAQLLTGDVAAEAGEVGYEVLCRRHHQHRLTRAAASLAARDGTPARIDLDAAAEPSTRPR